MKLRVKELEEQLKNNTPSLPNPTSTSEVAAASCPGRLDPLRELGGTTSTYWGGIHASTGPPHKKITQYYGPSSPFYFIGQISSYLGSSFQRPHSAYHLQHNSASKSFDSPTSSRVADSEPCQMAMYLPASNHYLTRTKEEYFLGLFWQAHHCTLQILDESEFREHYESLWTESVASRKPSALVDIVLAVSMQYGIAFIPRRDRTTEARENVDGHDATIAGRWYYRRCQTLIAHELESPSITTLQCHLLSAIYLRNASFRNMCHVTLAVAIRLAQILGLHLEPAEAISHPRRELRKRLWWHLYATEVSVCMKLGRPWSALISEVTCTLPDDDHESALLSGSNLVSLDNELTWLTYGSHLIKLIVAAQAIYSTYYDKCADVQGANGGKFPHDDPGSLEKCAEFLLSIMRSLKRWVQNVPLGLKTKRKGTGEAYSTDRSPLDIDLFAPLWLQRQRLVLELQYHDQAMNLYRPFIRFPPSSSNSTPFAEQNSISCVNHAIAITQIIHQMLTETDILNGWYEAFQWQWNASLSMVGFILAYPMHSSTPSARSSVNNAIAAFEAFGNNFAKAASAANVTRDLTAKADELINRFRNSLTTPVFDFSTTVNVSQTNISADLSSTLAGNEGTFSNALEGSMNLAFSIDSSNGFDLWDSDMGGMWNFAEDDSQLPWSWPVST